MNSVIFGGKNPTWSKPSNPDILLDAGPYIGIVKYVIDNTRSGRLAVYIPSLGGSDPDNSAYWYVVSYASPFRGKTRGMVTNAESTQQATDYNGSDTEENSFQSYGMWMVPPDVGSRVLCIFVEKKASQGYWFACIDHSYNSHMTPGIGAADTTAAEMVWDPGKFNTHKKLQNYIQLPSGEIPARMPVSEAPYKNQLQDASLNREIYNPNLNQIKKFPHVYQNLVLGKQGLCFDTSRGTTSASSLRETPSQVFGISTPGRYWSMSDESSSQQALASGNDAFVLKNFRVGGHQFVMDDGTTDGKDQGIRIRSSKGNMILLDDTNEQIYIVNSQGTAWVEMSPSGKIDIFSTGDFSVRSKGTVNFHAEQDFNVHARGKINMLAENGGFNVEADAITMNSSSSGTLYAAGSLQLGSGGTLNCYSMACSSFKATGLMTISGTMTYINTMPGATVNKPASIKKNNHTETKQTGGKQTWWREGEFKSIVTRAPDHEPWKHHEKETIAKITPPAAKS